MQVRLGLASLASLKEIKKISEEDQAPRGGSSLGGPVDLPLEKQ